MNAQAVTSKIIYNHDNTMMEMEMRIRSTSECYNLECLKIREQLEELRHNVSIFLQIAMPELKYGKSDRLLVSHASPQR